MYIILIHLYHTTFILFFSIMKPTKLYLSQYWDKFYAKTLKELKEKVWGWRVSKMYVDKKDWTTVHNWYVIWNLWLSAFIPYETPCNF